jgi:ribonuclease Z
MFDLLFLGTSASAPSAHRGLAAHLLMAKEYRFLIDCGEGTQRQIMRSGVGFKKLTRVLLTHAHLDHILGLGGLLSTLIRWEGIDQVEVFGSRATLERVYKLIYGVVLHRENFAFPIHLTEVKPGVFFDDKDFTISAFPVSHRGAGCYGYVFQEKPRRPFLSEKAEALGVPFGPERARLVRGEAVRLANGQIIDPEQVLGPNLPGARYVHTGDLGRTDDIIEHVRNAHALTIEATFLQAESARAEKFGHLTAAKAALLAREANVQTLLLSHLSRRNRERDVLNEAQAIFANTYVARDFDRFLISKEQPVQKLGLANQTLYSPEPEVENLEDGELDLDSDLLG